MIFKYTEQIELNNRQIDFLSSFGEGQQYQTIKNNDWLFIHDLMDLDLVETNASGRIYLTTIGKNIKNQIKDFQEIENLRKDLEKSNEV